MSRFYEQQGVAMTCRGFDEYTRMFCLLEEHLSGGEIVDVAAGASSFTADAGRKGYRSHAVDPRYALEPAAILADAAQEIETSTAKLRGIKDRMDFSYYGSLDRHRAMRKASLQSFAKDFERPDRALRYTAGMLPSLPFDSDRFHLVLCSHFLFLYAEQFGYDFHLEAVRELLRVCGPRGQVRIYPLHTLRYERYEHLDRLIEALQKDGVTAELLQSELPFIPGSRELLSLRKG